MSHINTLREGIYHYSDNGHSNAPNVRSTKRQAPYQQLHRVSDATMSRLNVSNAVGKTIDALCVKANQLENVYLSNAESSYRCVLIRNKHLGTDQLKHGAFAGNCGELAQFSEHILAASNSMMRNEMRRGGPMLDVPPVTFGAWSGDHGFTMLGDPRVSSPKEVVTVDGWVMRPAAHTLDHSHFSEGLTVRSSTVQEPEAYLDQAIKKKSLKELEIKYEGRQLSSHERQAWYNQMHQAVKDGRMHLWNHHHSDNTPDVVHYYSSPYAPPVSFDFAPRQEAHFKEDIDEDAKGSTLADAIQEGARARRQQGR